MSLTARQTTTRMITLNRILDMAKGQNSTELVVDRFVASRPILQTISAMNQFATRKSLEFTTTVGTTASSCSSSSRSGSGDAEGKGELLDSLEVTGDERRIKDIMQNLVSNAIKFTPGGGKVHTSLLTFDSLGGANEWWRKESGRFDEARWNGPTGVDATAGAGEDAGERGGGSGGSDGGSDRSGGSGGGSDRSGSSGGGTGGEGRGAGLGPARPPRWYVYCVEDNGIGILPTDFGHLMAKYKQISPAAAKEFSGTGLGLHVSSLHISLMSGSLGIASSFAGTGGTEPPALRDGAGTLFAVVLPLCPAAPLPPAAAERAAATAAASTYNKAGVPSSFWGNSPTRKLTFLVVDDHKLNVKLLQRKIQLTFEDSDVQVYMFIRGCVKSLN